METISDSEVEAALKRILAADPFKSSPKLRQFLNYIVTQKLNGKEGLLKAYAIAIDVYRYPPDFDPQIDPIIRVQARRLRAALNEYYLEAGANERIMISVPAGHYRPVFLEKQTAKVGPKPDSLDKNVRMKLNRSYMFACFAAFLLSVGLVFGWFIGSSDNRVVVDGRSDTITISMREDDKYLSDAADSNGAALFFRNLRSAMVRNLALSIILPSMTASDKNKTDFIIDTRFLEYDLIKYVSIELINGHTGRLVWSRSHTVSAIGEDIVVQVVRELNSQIFGASIRALEGRDPERLTASELFVLATWVPGAVKSSLEWERQRIELARIALRKDPEFGPAYSVLADKLAYLAAIDGPSNTSESADEAKASAALALELSAADANSLFNVAQYYSHSGQMDNSIAMMKRVLELDPSHGLAHFFSIVYPYSCEPAPDDVLSEIVRFDQSFGADNPARWVTLTWLGWLHLNRGEYAAALQAAEKSALIFQTPHTIIGQAVILNLLGRAEQATELIQSQKASWPNLDPAYFAKRILLGGCLGQGQQEKIVNTLLGLGKSIDDLGLE